MGTKEGLMALLRTAVVAAGIAVAMNAAAFAEDPGASTSPSNAAMPAHDSGKDNLTPEERRLFADAHFVGSSSRF